MKSGNEILAGSKWHGEIRDDHVGHDVQGKTITVHAGLRIDAPHAGPTKAPSTTLAKSRIVVNEQDCGSSPFNLEAMRLDRAGLRALSRLACERKHKTPQFG